MSGAKPASSFDTMFADRELEARLDETWRGRGGYWGWIATVDHKVIGRRYIITVLISTEK